MNNLPTIGNNADAPKMNSSVYEFAQCGYIQIDLLADARSNYDGNTTRKPHIAHLSVRLYIQLFQ